MQLIIVNLGSLFPGAPLVRKTLVVALSPKRRSQMGCDACFDYGFTHQLRLAGNRR